MTTISWNRAGISLGTLFALMHAAWLVLVGAGVSNQVISAVAEAHFLAFQYATVQLELATAILGILGAFASGYLLGAAFAVIWNLTGDYL